MRRHLPFAACVLLSAAMQTVIFPVAGPLPFVRAQLAWLACVPWFLVLIAISSDSRRPILRSTLWSYLCGALWYLGHCYWIFQTMHQYGNLSVPMAALTLILFCLYLGLYHAAFGALAAFLLRHLRSRLHPVILSLVLACSWVGIELARARITSFPWDLLGYSQIDNAALTALAPITGVYGLSFLIAFTNAALALTLGSAMASSRTLGDVQSLPHSRRTSSVPATLAIATSLAILSVAAGSIYHPPRPATTDQAVAVQPNLDPSPQSADPSTPPLEVQLATLTNHAIVAAASPRPSLILWPEAPTPWEIHEPLLQQTLTGLADSNRATVLADSNAIESDPTHPRHSRIFNAAGLFTAQGLQSRYDKIHLVPFGEFVPYADLFQFASGLTEQVGTFDRGTRRVPLNDGTHRYGVFICYESIFPDEVRQLALKGADVLVNLSDDGWYGDTSAPFQHSNMARMRATENRRWLLRDTNTGITESIDPYGNVRAVAPRHQRLAAVLPFAYSNTLTFYTRRGDIFAWLCAAFSAAAFVAAIAHPDREGSTQPQP